jgi:hypothetical protein
MIANSIKWIKTNNNYLYLIFACVFVAIGTYKYSFLASIIVFLALILLGLLAALLIRILAK